MKEQSQRQLRVGQQFRHELANYLHRDQVDHPLLAHAEEITVTEVSLSPDLKNARAYVLQLGQDAIDKDVLKALNEVAPRLQGPIARSLGMKATPRLHFAEDTTYQKSQRVNALLANIHIPKDDDAE